MEIICGNDLIRMEHLAQRKRTIEKAVEVLKNIEEFMSYINENEERIRKKVSKIKSIKSPEIRDKFLVVDPTNKFFVLTRISALIPEYMDANVFYVEMKPPLIPHVFLIASYLSLETGLYPSAVIRTEPVVSLIILLVRGDKLTALASQLATGMFLLERFARGETSIIPFKKELLELPIAVKDDTLYLSSLGYMTRPNKENFVVKVDFSDIPPLPPNIFSKFNFKPLSEIVSEIAEVLKNEYWNM